MDNINNSNPLKTWTQGYFSNPSLSDECFGFNEDVKEHWRRLLTNIENLDGGELRDRQQELLKLLEENGVTYNVYGDSNGLNRPWLLDNIPLLIASTDWRVVEKGMKQRAFVLNKI